MAVGSEGTTISLASPSWAGEMSWSATRTWGGFWMKTSPLRLPIRSTNCLINDVGIPVAEAVRMASLTPARVIGLDSTKGSLEPGKDADIAIFNDDFTAWAVLIKGQPINYTHEQHKK